MGVGVFLLWFGGGGAGGGSLTTLVGSLALTDFAKAPPPSAPKFGIHDLRLIRISLPADMHRLVSCVRWLAAW